MHVHPLKAMSATQTPDQFLQKMAASVRKNDIEQFCFHVQTAVAQHGEEKIATDMNERLPLILDAKDIPTLLKFLAGETYIDTVRCFLVSMVKVLLSMGYNFGLDYSYGEKPDGTPCLYMTQKIADKVVDIYLPYAWKQCLPYLVVS